MTELESILKETLDAQTRELGETLDRHQDRLDIQSRGLMETNLKLAELRKQRHRYYRTYPGYFYNQ
jgi:hypothetical protein